WECTTATSAIAEALSWLGCLDELRALVPAWRRQAERLGDVFAWVSAHLFGAHIELAGGDPKAARASARAAISRWWHEAFTYQHWNAAKTEIWCDLYEGDITSARDRLDVAFRALASANLLRVQMVRIHAL